MNRNQKVVQQRFLNNEKEVLKKLEKNYKDALIEINSKLELLMARQDADMQNVVYQIEHQKTLNTQVKSILEKLQVDEFETVSQYLLQSYEDGFIGTIYDMHGQKVPLILPISQEQVVTAIQNETKLSSNLYSEFSKDIKILQKKVAGEISRGISSGRDYAEIARNIAAYTGISQNRAMTIARTESHRIQNKAALDAMNKSKEKGAEVVKQWEATLDGNTRRNHRKLDGQIKELDMPFEINGHKVMCPGGFGRPEEDCNCRCTLLQRARWALDEEELKQLKKRAEYFELDKSETFEDFKKKYLSASGGLGVKVGGGDVPLHEEPKYMKTVDCNDKKVVMETIYDFEKEAVKESVENACVITADGKVYKCHGTENRVFPDFDLNEKLDGATITHNHPVKETSYTFSDDDLELFLRYNLEVLRGCDEKYTYEFTKDALGIDEAPEDWMNFENFEHARMIEKAKQLGIGYRRWLNEKR